MKIIKRINVAAGGSDCKKAIKNSHNRAKFAEGKYILCEDGKSNIIDKKTAKDLVNSGKAILDDDILLKLDLDPDSVPNDSINSN